MSTTIESTSIVSCLYPIASARKRQQKSVRCVIIKNILSYRV
ncbi:hypothetical protein HMPREF0239_00861 [Clostridium sp. ATCC BAA-442]|nr:hypothetical protein HMPREF0239_00861 [Clostridium sp. ATCC BAA-442]